MKKVVTVILIFLFFYSLSYCQNSDKSLIFDEYSISLNRTTAFFDDNTLNRMGFGLGTYFNFRPEKKFNLKIGFEYNYTSQEKIRIYEKPNTYYNNVKFNMGYISFPFLFRLNFGSDKKIFIELGVFADVFLHGKESGEYQDFGTSTTTEFSNKMRRFSDNYGWSLGIGAKLPFPVKNHKLIIKADYKLGLNSYEYYRYYEMYNWYYRISFGLIREHK